MNRFWIRLSLLASIFSALILAPNALAFAPCSYKMPEGVSYLPNVQACRGKAAIVLSGRFKNSFSAVLRTCKNGDRDPCYPDTDTCATNTSSPFKMQKTWDAIIERKGVQQKAKIHCLKERGESFVYKMVRRITIKRVNPVRNASTDILRLCLPSRIEPRNVVTVISTSNPKKAGLSGYNSACEDQSYLACNLADKLNEVCPIS
jgi:hypothetical protein